MARPGMWGESGDDDGTSEEGRRRETTQHRFARVPVRRGRSRGLPRRDGPAWALARRVAARHEHLRAAPGQAICPYHYEYAEEEWLLVLEGRPTLRHPEGESVLEPWDVVVFPTGPEGAHGVRNETDETARVLMASTVRHPAATVYPDSDKIAVWTGNKDDDVIVHRDSRRGLLGRRDPVIAPARGRSPAHTRRRGAVRRPRPSVSAASAGRAPTRGRAGRRSRSR